ncbi:UNVERIFIED_ORG: hypothetical protein ABIB21_002249 [Arthrobacter sp. UYEF13]
MMEIACRQPSKTPFTNCLDMMRPSATIVIWGIACCPVV